MYMIPLLKLENKIQTNDKANKFLRRFCVFKLAVLLYHFQ